MDMNGALFTSNAEEWETPQSFFAALDAEFHFTLDACAAEKNKKCSKFYTRETDGLSQNWTGETVFCNPPYGRKIHQWIRKCAEEGASGETTVVALLPARTDTAAFHDYIYGKAEIRFVRGRLKFGGATNNAPFPSMVVIWRPVHSGSA